MKNRLLVFCTILSIFFTSVVVQAQTTVLGYFPSYRATNVIRYDKLTDIVFSFINPDASGNLITNNPGDALYGFDNNKFVVVRDNAASNNVRLWIALGGADSGEQRAARLSSVSGNATTRARLVSQFVQFAIDNGCYGIDIDWEFPKTPQAKANHLALMQALNTEIANSSNPNLQVSIAVGGEYTGSVNHIQYLDPSLFTTNANLVDKWHIMAYDFPSSYGTNHSSLADAQGSMDGWNAMGVPYSKMVLGVPFYARNSNRSSELMYSQLGGTASTNYNNDSYNGWYYNGKPTLEAKMQLTSDKGAAGILIWDLGQDRAAGNFSLLDAIDAKAATLCPVPKANLGPDKGVCLGQSTTLDAGVAAAGGRTFVWKRNGTITGGNTTTIDVNQAGTYTVEITQGGCTRDDEIVIVTGSSVTTQNASGCDDETLTVSVNSPAQGKTYKWFDAESGGLQLGTGNSYSDVFASNTTVYVEEASDGVVSYTSDPQTIPLQANNIDPVAYSWAGGQYTQLCAQMIVVESDLTIKSLRAIASARNGVSGKVKVINSSNHNAVDEAGPFSISGDNTSPTYVYQYLDMTIDITLSPGTYFVYFEPDAGSEGNYGFINTLFQESAEAGVYTLKGSMFQSSTDKTGFNPGDEGQNWWAAYGPFLNWNIETGANASCGRTAATITVQQCGPPVVDITKPIDGTDFLLTDSVKIDATITDEGSISSVVFEIYKGANLVATLPVSSNGSTYSAAWLPNATGNDYSVRVTAVDNQSNSTTDTVFFTVSTDVSVNRIASSDVSLFPNPSNSEFTLNISGVNNYSVYVYSVSGQLVSSSNVTTNNYRFGSDLKPGLYILRVVSDAGVYQSQIIKN
jgi:GH18 family chitinase